MSFEDALAELEQIVRRLEAGQVKLDDAILSYERGTSLRRHCENKLNEAQAKVDRITSPPTVPSPPNPYGLNSGERTVLRDGRGGGAGRTGNRPSAAHVRHDRSQLFEAMRYAAWAAASACGPFWCSNSAVCSASPGAAPYAWRAGVEMVHCYSLIHDDLPAMDNSDLRRGRPTVHRQFDEATAMLAGDGLLTLAFEVLADPDTHGDPAVRC